MQRAMAHLEAKLKIAEEPQLVSVYADYGYHAHCLKASESMKEPFIRQYFAALCDFNNVITFLVITSYSIHYTKLYETDFPLASASR